MLTPSSGLPRDMQRLPTTYFSLVKEYFACLQKDSHAVWYRTLHLKEGERGVFSLATETSFIDPSVRIVTKSPKVIILGHQTLDPDPESGSAIRNNAGSGYVSGSALNQCGSETLKAA